MVFLTTDDASMLKGCTSIDEVKLMAAVNNMPFVESSVDDAYDKLESGKSKVLTTFHSKLVVFDILEKNLDRSLTIHCQNFPLKDRFDEKTNMWKDCSLRKRMNRKSFISKFEPVFAASVQKAMVHTEDYVTEDKFWLLSHEEIGRTVSWLKQNNDVQHFPAFQSYLGKSPWLYWWLRSAHYHYSSNVGSVNSDGDVSHYHCEVGYIIAPACVIK